LLTTSNQNGSNGQHGSNGARGLQGGAQHGRFGANAGPGAAALEPASDDAILVSGVSLRYRMPTEKITSLKEQVIRTITRRTVGYNEFWALRNINLRIRFGDSVALVGRNGAGKSSLLKVIARVIAPTSGRVVVRGNVAPIIELGAGFHPELTGRENIFLNGAMLGFSEAAMKRKFASIVDFSELEAFIDSPLRTYSSGMTARLAFSVAAEADPDLLIIDEVLSVGDEAFQKKCQDRMLRFRERGITILFVTHSLDGAAKLCERAVWIEEGRALYSGPTQKVVTMFRESMEFETSLSATQKRQVVQVNR
jgi:ABC-type polysaccharide/polyol phosphate transport system ATPase subunit